MSIGEGAIQLRAVSPSDLPVLFEFQLDAESNRMAFTHPRSRAEFDAHWDSAVQDKDVVARVVTVDGCVAGQISCYKSDGQAFVGYWIGRPFWGRGIASRALERFLQQVSVRPLYSRVASTNIASLRVLRKCGFEEVGREWSPASRRYVACEEVVMKLAS